MYWTQWMIMFSFTDLQSQLQKQRLCNASNECRFPKGPKDHLNVAGLTVLTYACVHIRARDYSDNRMPYIRGKARFSVRYKSRDTSPTAPTSNNSNVSVHIRTSDICSTLGVSQVVCRQALWQHKETLRLGPFEQFQMPGVIKWYMIKPELHVRAVSEPMTWFFSLITAQDCTRSLS